MIGSEYLNQLTFCYLFFLMTVLGLMNSHGDCPTPSDLCIVCIMLINTITTMPRMTSMS